MNETFSKIKLKPDCTTLIKGMTVLVKLSGSGKTNNTDMKVKMGAGDYKRIKGQDENEVYYGSHNEKILNQKAPKVKIRGRLMNLDFSTVTGASSTAAAKVSLVQ